MGTNHHYLELELNYLCSQQYVRSRRELKDRLVYPCLHRGSSSILVAVVSCMPDMLLVLRIILIVGFAFVRISLQEKEGYILVQSDRRETTALVLDERGYCGSGGFDSSCRDVSRAIH